MEFNPRDPFPLAPAGTSYALEKAHSEQVDQWLGISFLAGEQFQENEGQVSWQQKGPSVFLTPYSECRRILQELQLQDGETLLDFGAGYGRMGHVLETHYPQGKFIGLEVIPSRVIEANRVASQWQRKFRLQLADICADKFTIPSADVYFLYDFGSEEQIRQFLENFRVQKGQTSLRFVGRGGRVRHLVHKHHPWLWDVTPAQHFANYSIFSSVFSSANPR
jgi:hypothetical protein